MAQTIPVVIKMARRKLEVRRNQPVKLPNGRTIRITFINHPGAVIIAPFLNKDTVVMMRQFRPALKKYIYELPAGTLDPHESIAPVPVGNCWKKPALKPKN